MSHQWDIGPGLWGRARRWFEVPWVADASVVLALAVLAVAEHFLPPYYGLYLQRPIDAVLMSVVLAALLFRRVRPLLAFIIVMSVIFGWVLFWKGGANTADLSILIAIYAVAAYRGLWWGIVALAIEAVAYYPGCGGVCAIGTTTSYVFVVIAGVAVHEGRRLHAELAEQTDVLRRTRDERVRLAVSEERARVARDVHDMVAHGVTLMVIQAGAARWLAESDPRKADKALRSVETAGQEALHELHALVGSMGSASSRGVEPLPARQQLSIPSLVQREVASGLRVELVTQGVPHELDAGLELSLYRIVQEALTNVRKHAPGARAWVELTYTSEGVEVEVTDSGGQRASGSPPTVPGAGQGLVGISERAALFGGRAEAGPTPQGGFRVRATLAEEQVLV